MKYLSTLLSQLRPVRILLSIMLAAVLVFSSTVPALAAKSSPLTKGTVQLDKIEQKTQESIDSPATSMKAIQKNSEGGLNEIQGTADINKMIRTYDEELPAVKQTEKALDKINRS